MSTGPGVVLNHDNKNRPKLPSGLNVLTILTFIGCALQLLGALWNFFNAKKAYEEIDKTIEQMTAGGMTSLVKWMIGKPEHYREFITKSYEQKVPILLLGLLGIALCFFGAWQMRKLKKQGFSFYVIGELLPFLSHIIIIGVLSLTGLGFVFYFFVCIALLFLLMYSMQRKNLIH